MSSGTAGHISLAPLWRRLWSLVPLGGSLPEDVWRKRHRFLVGLTWFHAVIIALVGPVLGYKWELSLEALFRDGTVIHTIGEGLIVALFVGLAMWRKGGRKFRATAVGFGLMSSSAILVHLSGGYIELHFHFFVMLVFLALYQDWAPYLISIVYVAIHHGTVGVLWPEEVYNHPAAINAPWTWAGIHAFFVLWSCVGSVIAWRFNETAEIARRAAEARFAGILDIAADAIIAVDESQRIILFNKGAEQVFGYSTGEVLGRPLDLLLPPRFAETHRRHIHAFAAASEPARHMGERREVFGRRRDGTEFPAEASISKLTQDGQTIFTVILHDIAKRKEAEKQTQRNLERVRALREIDEAITSTLEVNAVLKLLLEKIDLVLPYSATTVRLFNKESMLLEPVACRNLDEKEWKAKEWRGGRGTPNTAFAGKAPVMVGNVQTDPRVKDPEFFRKNGLVSYLGVPLIVQDEVLGVISFYTKEKHEFSHDEVDFLATLAGQAAIAIHNSQLYQEMIKLAADLSNSNRVKDEFLSVMSHELRTPLNVVMGYTGMIKDRLLGEINREQEKALEKVISRARDQLSMVGSILQATQLEAEGVRVEAQEVSLGDFLDDLRSNYALPSGKDLALRWDYPLDLPVINTDSEKLKQILHNLIDNAIKFTDTGSVTVSVRCLDETGRGGRQKAEGGRRERENLSTASGRLPAGRGRWVEFRVADSGTGIAEEHQSMIFERFRQVDSSETRKYGGVGIGLYIVKKFTEMLDGEIAVESEVGKGSTFTVTLPLNKSAPPPA